MQITEQDLTILKEKVESAQTILSDLKAFITKIEKDKPRIQYANSKPEPKKKSKDVKPTILIKRMIDFWNGSGLRKHQTPSTKVYQDIIKRMKKLTLTGSFFNSLDCFKQYHNYKFTEEEISSSIQNFIIMTTNPDFKPVKKDFLAKMSMLDFFYNTNPNSKSETKSYFIYCLENKPEIMGSVDTVEDTNPNLTMSIKRIYSEKVLGGIRPKFSEFDENKFRIASSRLTEFVKENGNRLNTMAFSGIGGSREQVLAGFLFSSVLADVGGEAQISKITPGWLCSDMTFSKRLPSYLNQQGIILRRQG